MNYNLTPKQMMIYQDASRELLIFGGIRSGKTNVMLIKLLAAASRPNSRVGLFRKTLVSLKLTTLKSLIEGDGVTPPILPMGSYIHNMSEKTITLKGGGSIVYSSLEEPERIRGMTLNSAFIDEGTDLTETDYITILGRVSAKTETGLQVVMSCNSKHPEHWVAKRWNIVGNQQAKPIANRKAFLLNPTDNPYLSNDYLEMLHGWHGSLAYDRDVLGKWISPEGLVFNTFDPNRHVKSVNTPFSRYVIGVDVGFRDPFCALLIGVDQDGNAHVVREIYQTQMNESKQISAIESLCQDLDVDGIYVDYAGSGVSLISSLQNIGLPARKATKDRFQGINKVRDRITANRITIDSGCVNLLREVQSWEYKPNSEAPIDGNDHSLDALRYAIMGIDSNRIGDLVVSEEKMAQIKEKMDTRSYEQRMWDEIDEHPSFRKI